MSDDDLVHIFEAILDWHLSTKGFPASACGLAHSLVGATLEVYAQSMAKLLPTPTKSHYVFNLRDFARVVQVRGVVCVGGWGWVGGGGAAVHSLAKLGQAARYG